MSSAYQQLLEATIQHLETLKASGVRHIAVTPETLRALGQPTARALVPAGAATRPPAPTLSKPSTEPRFGSQRPPLQPAAPALVSKPALPPPPVPQLVETATQPPKSDAEKETAFAELRERAMVCVKCPKLAATRKTVVFGVGNINADLMFVGEAPGADEDAQGEPFVGKAGQLLTKIIQATGLQRSDVYIANILKCRPDMPPGSMGNRKPTPEEMATCIPYLHEQIDLIRPKVLVALGGTAMEGLLNLSGITKLRGHWHSYRGIPLMPTYHPSYLLRNQALHEKRRVWEDMLQVMEKLNLPISEKQQNFFLKA
jgi:uracil-DNA glycosylase